jgi:hypothetical protein
MNYENDAGLDPAAWLLFEIVRNACVPDNGSRWCSAKECLKTYSKRFQAATRVLAWLDLVTPAHENPLGCCPGDLLMSLISVRPEYRLMSSSPKGAPIARHLMETMIDAALKQDAVDNELTDWAVQVLGEVGLVRYHPRVKRPVPTQLLGSLIVRATSQERRLRYATIKTERTRSLEGSQLPVSPASS